MNQRNEHTVMVVDDDKDFLKLAKRALESKGFQVDARSKAPNWEELKRVDPAVVFMDIELDGENGVDICHAMKTTQKISKLPVILISGHGEQRLKEETMKCHADGFLSKPISSHLMVQLAAHYVAAHHRIA